MTEAEAGPFHSSILWIEWLHLPAIEAAKVDSTSQRTASLGNTQHNGRTLQVV